MEKKDKIHVLTISLIALVLAVLSCACSLISHYETQKQNAGSIKLTDDLLRLKNEMYKMQVDFVKVSQEFEKVQRVNDDLVNEVHEVKVKCLEEKDELKEMKKRIVELETEKLHWTNDVGRTDDQSDFNKTYINRIKRETTAALPGSNCGRDGRDGPPGPQGPPGRDGRDGSSGQGFSISDITNLLEHLHKTMSNNNNSIGVQGPQGPPGPRGQAGGAVYVRWGRTTCPNNAENVYSGVMGGSFHSQTGSGANFLCLPKEPEWGKTVAGFQSDARIYGVEFGNFENSPFLTDNFPDPSKPANWLYDHDAVCAVCRVQQRNSKVMIPALKSCPELWTLEYKGYLMSQQISHQKSEFICFDEAPEADIAGHENRDGGIIRVVEGACGSLPCPNYIDGYELTCAVCTK
ncbi:unnamed protein product [Owenia fusiformis]|uniref:Uncharacterized protein n=1 Tax=Owenia fusiformis TaxID=6347 RepID=A0A8S4QBU8_OWEFU|nr:unnamed protein product [Owenia fusiformis]